MSYKEKSRERRIRDKQRMKAKAKWVAKNSWGYKPDNLERAIKHADYLAVCSCDMCGNPRRHFGQRTLQEVRVGYNDGKIGNWAHPHRYRDCKDL